MRATPKIPSYRLHKPTKQAVVRLDGRDRYLGRHGTPESRAEYQRLVAEWLTTKRNHAVASPGNCADLELTELVDAFLDWADGYYVKNGRATGEISSLKEALRPLVRLYGRTRAADFGPVGLKTVREDLVASGLSRGVVNARINRIRRVFKWGVENQLVTPAVLEGLRAVSPLKAGRCGVREAPPVLPVSSDQIDAVLAIAPPEIAAMIRLQLLTGMRPGEVVQMRRRDLDTSGSNWTYTPAEHKTEHQGRQRVIFLGPRARQVLEPFLGLELDACLFSPREIMAARSRERRAQRQTPMTPSQRAREPKPEAERRPGDRYTTQSYGRAIARLCEQAFPHPTLGSQPAESLTAAQRQELKAWRASHRWAPNRLRHNAATALRKAYGIEAARVVLGHSSAGVTEVYAERDLARAAEVMEKLG